MEHEKQVRIALRMPPRIVKKIEQVVRAEGSTISQFFRTAAINELNQRKSQAA